MAMAQAMAATGALPDVTVIEAGPEISGVGDRARKKLLHAMAGFGIKIRCNAKVAQITPDRVILEDASEIPAILCVGAAGAFPHPWIARTDLPLQNGFIRVEPDLSVTGDETIFAVGDCAAMPFAPRPKAGVFAVRAAPVLYDNLRAALSGAGSRKWI